MTSKNYFISNDEVSVYNSDRIFHVSGSASVIRPDLLTIIRYKGHETIPVPNGYKIFVECDYCGQSKLNHNLQTDVYYCGCCGAPL